MREVIIFNATTNPQVCFPKYVEIGRGYLLGFGVATETDGSTDSCALVEREDGRVEMIYPTRIKFVEPYATTAKLAATPAGIARACGMENEVGAAQDVSATNPPAGFAFARKGDARKSGYIYWSTTLRSWSIGSQEFVGHPVEWYGFVANPIEVAP